MTRPPTIDQLRNLADRAGMGLTPDETARLREGINRLAHTENALARIAAIADDHPAAIDTALIHEALDQPEPATPAATQATDTPVVDRQTAVVLAALHHSAETTVSRVIDLYERWVKAGPPPLGTSINRLWDMRLAELHNAIQPPYPATPRHNDGPSIAEAREADRRWPLQKHGE